MMPRWPVTACVSLCLLGAIAWELRDAPIATGPAIVPLPSSLTDTGPVPDEAERSIVHSLAELQSRPLFRPDRRPPSSVSTAETPAPDEMEARLTGIIVGPFGGRAIFQVGTQELPVVAQEGDRVGGYLIRSLRPAEAVVDFGGKVVTLVPSAATSATAASR